MDKKRELAAILAEAASKGHNLRTRVRIESLANFLLASGVVVLHDEVILSKSEIAALNEYQNKHFGGGGADGCGS